MGDFVTAWMVTDMMLQVRAPSLLFCYLLSTEPGIFLGWPLPVACHNGDDDDSDNDNDDDDDDDDDDNDDDNDDNDNNENNNN